MQKAFGGCRLVGSHSRPTDRPSVHPSVRSFVHICQMDDRHADERKFIQHPIRHTLPFWSIVCGRSAFMFATSLHLLHSQPYYISPILDFFLLFCPFGVGDVEEAGEEEANQRKETKQIHRETFMDVYLFGRMNELFKIIDGLRTERTHTCSCVCVCVARHYTTCHMVR